jgi:hypothetical protein
LTSTDLSLAYADSPLLARALEAGLDEQLCAALVEPKVGFGERAAVIQALGWSLTGQAHAASLLDYIARQRGVSAASLELQSFSAEELFSLGFLLAMDHYQTLQPMGGEGALSRVTPAEFLSAARAKAAQSFTVQFVEAMVLSQQAMHQDWCAVYRLLSGADEGFVGERDLQEASVESVRSYARLFASECVNPRPVAGP